MNNTIIADLDGTLIKFDSSFAIAKKLTKRNLLLGARFAWIYLFQGEAKIKQYVSRLFDDFEYQINKNLLAFLESKKDTHQLVMATGANIKVANKINKDLNFLFHKVIASDETVNRIGHHKLTEIKNLTKSEPFMYIGDSWHDCIIWKHAAEVGFVPSNKQHKKLLKFLQNLNKPTTIFEWTN